MRGRPELVTSYEQDEALLGTTTKRVALLVFLAVLFVLPLLIPDHMSNDLNTLLARAFMAGIGAIGINIVTGYCGQVSLGHAFFLGLGAYTAAVLNGDPDAAVLGFGIDNMLIWLPLAGLVPAFVGLLVAPIAMRVRGLYLAIVTLGLVFLGLHLFNTFRGITGGIGVGRRTAVPEVFGFEFRGRGEVLGVLTLDRAQRLYYLGLIVLVILTVLAANLVRGAPGRAFAAVRDRDIAAEAMGVDLFHAKTVAFVVSSFYAGIAGALLSTTIGSVNPESYGLLLSVEYLAMILIGGIATMSGSLIGAGFVVVLPRLIEEVPRFVPFVSPGTSGGVISSFQLQTIIFGLLIVAFLILEPRGMYGLWVRVRNYFKAWPFSY